MANIFAAYPVAGGSGGLSNPVTVPEGGSGATTFIPYMPIVGGTTSTGPFQSVSNIGASAGYVLTYVNSHSLPTWQAVGAGSSPLTTEGDMYYFHSGVNSRLPIGTAGQALTTNGTDPSWNSVLNDSSSVLSIDWINRALVNSAGQATVLYDDSNSGGGGNLLIDDTGTESVDWFNRDLYDTDGNQQFSWDTGGVGFGTATVGTALVLSGATSGATTIQAAAVTTSYTLTLPPSEPGVNGYVLTTNGSGVTTWAAPSTVAAAGTLTGNTLAAGVTHSSLSQVGVVTSGEWRSSVVAPQFGGTGINSSASTGIPSISSGTWSVSTNLALANPQTTLTGSAGTAVCSQPFQGSSYKKVVVYLNGYTDTGTQTYTFPTAFSNTPYVYGLTAGVAGATATTTTVTFTVTTQTGFVFIEGY